MVAAILAPLVAPAAQGHAEPRPAAPRFAWWRFLERARTHEVLVEWREAEGVLRLRETCPGAPDSRLDEALRIAKPWEARVALWQIECRLNALGSYWQQKSTDAAWHRLLAPPGASMPDARRNMVIDVPHAPLVHHYHDERGGGDNLIAALRGQASRFLVLRAQLDVPSLEIGRIDVLHANLAQPMTRSLVMREQMVLAQAGQAKLVSRDDYVRSFGHGGEVRAARLIDEVVGRVRDQKFERPAARLEDRDIYAEFLLTVNDPRLHALHHRFLAPGEEAALLAAGPVAIRKAVATKRAAADHNARHLLTILEASLLARERMLVGKLVRSDPEVRALTRLAYYL
jgi:hypothetical protein